MNKRIKQISGIILPLLMLSCGTLGGAAQKNWTAQEVDEFLNDCQRNAIKLMGEEQAKTYCDCAIDKVAKSYESYKAVKKAALRDLRKVAKSCE